MDPEIIAAFIGPVFTAMLAGVGILIKSIQVRNREQHARARDLDVATRTVDFINTYLAAQDKLLPRAEQQIIRERALRDLEVAYQTMMATANADYQNDSTGAWIRVIKRALLFGLNRTSAKVVRIFFYIFTVLNVLLFGVWMGYAVTDPDLIADIPVMIFVIVFGIIGFFVPIMLLYIWARWLDRDRATTPPSVDSGAEPMLGHYGNWPPMPQQTPSYGPGQMPAAAPPYPPR